MTDARTKKQIIPPPSTLYVRNPIPQIVFFELRSINLGVSLRKNKCEIKLCFSRADGIVREFKINAFGFIKVF